MTVIRVATDVPPAGDVVAEVSRADLMPVRDANFLDILRGTAPIIVIWAHMCWWFDERGVSWAPVHWWKTIVSEPLGLLVYGGPIAVLMFCFLSGYVITHVSRTETVATFAIRRVGRIAPALWIGVVVTWLCGELVQATGRTPTAAMGFTIDAVDVLRSAFLIDQFLGFEPVNGVTWTLAIEVTFYVLTAVLMSLTKTSAVSATLVMGLAAGFLIWIISVVPGHGQVEIIWSCLPYILIGRIAYLRAVGLINNGNVALLTGVVVVDLAIAHAFGGQPIVYSESPAVFVIAAIVCFGLVLRPPLRVPDIFRVLSDRSYSMYLLHVPIGFGLMDVIVGAGHSVTLAFIAAMTATVAAADFVYRHIEVAGIRAARRWTTAT